MATKPIFAKCFGAALKRMGEDKLSAEDFAKLQEVYTDQFFQARRGQMSLPEAVQAAKAAAAKRAKIDKGLQQYRAAKQILAISENHGYANANRGVHRNVMDSAAHKLMAHYDGKGRTVSADVVADGVVRDARRAIDTMTEAIGTKAMGLVEHGGRVRLFVEAMFGRQTGDAAIDAAAKQVSEMFERLRLRANRAGAAIGRVSERYLPQSHDALRIAKMPRDEWVTFMLDKIDTARYANEDGSLQTQAQLRAMLGEAYMTLATDGANKPAAQQFGSGSVATRNSKQRVLHFKDAASWLAYHEQFGAHSPTEMIDSATRKLADQIALLETMGPNPAETVNALYNLEAQRLKDAGDTAALIALDKDKELADFLLGELTGANIRLKKGKAAAFWRNIRALQSFKLGAAYVTSLTDRATMHLTAALWKMSHADLTVESLRRLNPADQAHRMQIINAGLMADGGIVRMEMLGSELSRSTLIDKATNAHMKLSLLNWATKTRRESFNVVMSNTLGSMVDRVAFKDLNAVDNLAIREYGIAEADWNIWKAATKEDWGRGETMLTAGGIYGISDEALGAAVGRKLDAAAANAIREQAVSRYLGMVSSEAKMAVLEPSRLTRAKINRFVGDSEIARAMLQFKSFPIAMFAQHLVRGINMPGGAARAYYLTALFAGMTVMGGVTMSIADILNGRNPRPLLDPDNKNFLKSWGAAALKGGALGIFGDFLFAQQSRYGSQVGSILTGPAIGDLLTVGDIMLQARSDIAAGEAPDIGAKTLNVAKSYIPFASLWYTRGLFNHAFVQNAQEMLNPGYMRRMQARMRRDYGQTLYWQPGEALPDRPPELEALTGE
jgi:hypothetical protein